MTQKWYYISEKASDILSNSYIFSKMKMTDFIFNSWGGGGGSTWSITEKGLYSTGANATDLVFIKNEKSEYVLKTKFQLSEHTSNVGGLGIFFETTLDSSDNNKDTGYILQFDRGFSEIVIRSRVNGSESSSQGAQILARIGNRSTSTIFNTNIPHNSNSDWWQSEKELILSVKPSDTLGKKLISVFLNGEVLLNEFSIDSNINSEDNNAGFRAWNGAPVSVESLNIE